MTSEEVGILVRVVLSGGAVFATLVLLQAAFRFLWQLMRAVGVALGSIGVTAVVVYLANAVLGGSEWAGTQFVATSATMYLLEKSLVVS